MWQAGIEHRSYRVDRQHPHALCYTASVALLDEDTLAESDDLEFGALVTRAVLARNEARQRFVG